MHRRAKCLCEVSSVLKPGKPPPSLQQALSSRHALHFKHSVCMWLCIEVHVNAVLSIFPIDFCILFSTPKIPTVWTISECFVGDEFRSNTSLMPHKVPLSFRSLFSALSQIFSGSWRRRRTVVKGRTILCETKLLCGCTLGRSRRPKIYLIAKTGSNSSWKCSYRPIQSVTIARSPTIRIRSECKPFISQYE